MKLTRIAAGVAIALATNAAAAAPGFNFSQLWTFTHASDVDSKVGGVAEIVSFNSITDELWVVGAGATQTGIDVLDLSGVLTNSIDTTGFGGINSVTVNQSGLAAVSLTAPVNTDPGSVRFYNAAGSFVNSVMVGANPDNVTFTPDGTRLLIANEGEPNSYNQVDSVDPVGSVGIIDVTGGAFTYQDAGFSSFNAQAAALAAAGVRLNGPNASVAQDLEPEYIAVSADGSTAYATLQEANSIAVVDIASATVTDIVPLGLKDHSLADNGYTIDGIALGNGIDASDRDGAGNDSLDGNIQLWNVKGMYMPDSIAAFESGGDQYFVIANEGDGREYTGFEDETRAGGATIDPALEVALAAAHGADWQTNNDKLNRLTVSTSGDLDGDGDLDELQSYGARSFSIIDDAGAIVFDSGDFLEQVIASDFPSLWTDGRSDNKGPEPESVVVGSIGSHDLLFLGLERSDAIAVFDITDIADIRFLEMLVTAGDDAPEGLSFFIASNGMSYLAVANEGSGTTTLYSVAPVPVPAAVWLFGSALLGLGAGARRRRPDLT